MLDVATHAECLEFIRAAIASNDRTTAKQIAAVFKDCCQRGYADQAAIWNELTPSPANCIPRAAGHRIRKFTPKN